MKRSSRFGFRKHFSENSLLLMVWTSLQSFSKLDAQFFGLGCDLNDMSAPLPHLSHIRRMMKRQVLECGIQVPFSIFLIDVSFFGSELRHAQDIGRDAAKFLSDALDIYLQVRHHSICCTWPH